MSQDCQVVLKLIVIYFFSHDQTSKMAVRDNYDIPCLSCQADSVQQLVNYLSVGQADENHHHHMQSKQKGPHDSKLEKNTHAVACHCCTKNIQFHIGRRMPANKLNAVVVTRYLHWNTYWKLIKNDLCLHAIHWQ